MIIISFSAEAKKIAEEVTKNNEAIEKESKKKAVLEASGKKAERENKSKNKHRNESGIENKSESETERKIKCPACLKAFPRKSILKHTSQALKCKKILGIDGIANFKKELNKQCDEEEEKKRQSNVEYQRKFTEKIKQMDEEGFKEINRRKVEKFRERKRELDPESLKESQNKWQS